MVGPHLLAYSDRPPFYLQPRTTTPSRERHTKSESDKKMHHRHLFGFVFVLFCVVAAALVPRAEAYGEPVSSRPSYQERTVGALINAARVGTALSLSLWPTSQLSDLNQDVRELMT